MSNVIKFDIGTKLFYHDLEYQVKGYPSFDEVLLKREVESSGFHCHIGG